MAFFKSKPKRQELEAYAEALQPNGAASPKLASPSAAYLENINQDIANAEDALSKLGRKRTESLAEVKAIQADIESIDAAIQEVEIVRGFLGTAQAGIAKVAAEKEGHAKVEPLEGTPIDAATNVKEVAGKLKAEGEEMEKARKAAH